jgi:RNA polymerase sigma-70 factor, ECF subfamily
MLMAEPRSLPALLGRVKAGDQEAAALIFRRYTRRLIALARRQLDTWVRDRVDPEDVVQSVYKSFFARHARGDFSLDSWDSLWALLCLMTVRKCADKADYLQAACRDVRLEIRLPGDAEGSTLWKVPGRDPTPAEAALLTETIDRLLRGLEEEDRVIVVLHLQGYTLHEISDRAGRAHRTVRRVIDRARRRLLRLRADEEAAG